MAYSDQSLLSQDGDFLFRVAACGTTEGLTGTTHPVAWAGDVVWLVAAAPGFADKYASALAGGVERPGNDPAVISDADILSAVQALPPTP